MGYRKNLSTRKYKKRTYRKKGAVKAYRMASKALSLINAEHKYVDNMIYQNYNVPTNSSIGCITGIPQGTDYNQRTGNSIKAKSIAIDYSLQCRPGTTDSSVVRVMLIHDKESKGLVPLATDILVSDDVYARYNPSYAGSRFKILFDKRHVIGFNDTTNYHAGGVQGLFNKVYRKLYQHVRYNGTTALQANCTAGHIYVLIVSDSSQQVGITMNTRFTYLDN